MDTAAASAPRQHRPVADRAGASVTALVRPVEHPLGHLDLLESLAIFIIREVAAESERPVLLFSGGKDSAVLLHLASKAFKPGRIPFPVLHVDTGHNFPEVLAYRDAQVEAEGARLLVAKVQDSIDQGRVSGARAAARHATGCRPRRCSMRSTPAGSTPRSAGRAATRTRPGPRNASSRSATTSASGTPSASGPSCGSSTTAASARANTCACSHSRTGPSWTSGSTSTTSSIEIPSIYFSHKREVVEPRRHAAAPSEWVSPTGRRGRPRSETVRFRTVGDVTCTGAVRSDADTVEEIIREISASRVSERGETRADDRFSETAMEDRKRDGYF